MNNPILNTEEAEKALAYTESVLKDLQHSYRSDPHKLVDWERVANSFLALVEEQQRLIKWLWTSKIDKP